MDFIREYVHDSPVYNPEDEPSQYNIPYVPPSPVYHPPSSEYTPSAITTIPGLDLLVEEKEENVHIKFTDPPESPPQKGDVSLDISSSGPPQLQTASMHPTSDATIILHPKPSGPPQGMSIPVHISESIPPELMLDTDLDEEMQHADHLIEDGTKEEGECTNEDDQDMPPLVDVSTDEAQTKKFPPDPWNDSTFTLQERLDQIRWEYLEPEPNYELYGVNRGDEQRQEILLEVGRMHRCVDQMKKMLQSIGEFQDNLQDSMTQRAEVKLQVNQINRNMEEITHSVNAVSESQDSIKSILKDLYDIINDMNDPDRSDSQDFELLQKINDISNRMTQVNLGQESVQEVVTELKGTLERKPRNNKRGCYQTIDCATPHYEEQVKHPRLSSDLNFAYFDRQYGEILEVPKNREVRRGLKERFLELHETAQKWEILNYHLKVICIDNKEHISPPVLETDAYLLREEAYLTIFIVSKLF